MDRESRYKAKAAIDTAVYRGGDLAFAWVHKGLLLFGTQAVFVGGVVLAATMSFAAWRVIREQAGRQDVEAPFEGPSAGLR